jgi:hypothetical protein
MRCDELTAGSAARGSSAARSLPHGIVECGGRARLASRGTSAGRSSRDAGRSSCRSSLDDDASAMVPLLCSVTPASKPASSSRPGGVGSSSSDTFGTLATAERVRVGCGCGCARVLPGTDATTPPHELATLRGDEMPDSMGRWGCRLLALGWSSCDAGAPLLPTDVRSHEGPAGRW